MSELSERGPNVFGSVKLSKNDLSTWKEKDFSNFFKKYDKCQHDLCIDKDTKQKNLDLHTQI